VSEIYGDGDTSRDFCYIANAVQANLLAATTENPEALDQVYNIAYGERTTLEELNGHMREELQARLPDLQVPPSVHKDFRPGDVRHSLASINKARTLLGYEPSHSIRAGLSETMDWYVRNLA
jgi:UDP-N-acetylglucosamine 4-epimerase